MANYPISETLTGAAVLVITQAFNWWNGRDKSRAYAQGAVDRAMQRALQGVSDQLRRSDERMADLEAQHAVCETSLRDVNARLDTSQRQHEDERAALRAEIERLLAERGAAPPYDTLTRPLG